MLRPDSSLNTSIVVEIRSISTNNPYTNFYSRKVIFESEKTENHLHEINNTQMCLNHLAILNVHCEESNSLNMKSVANDYTSSTEICKSTLAVKM